MNSKRRVRSIQHAHLTSLAAVVVLVAAACGSGLESGSAVASGSTAVSRSAETVSQYRFEFFDIPGAGRITVRAINDLGVVVGGYTDANGIRHAFIRSPGGAITTVDVGGGGIWGINDSGVSVGLYADANGNLHGFKRTADGQIAVIDLPGAADTGLTAINNLGAIAGGYDLGDQSKGGSFVLRNGKFTILADPPDAPPFSFQPSGVNDEGVVSGFWFDASGNDHGFILRQGEYTTVDYPGASSTDLWKINDRGMVVGISDIGSFVFNTVTKSFAAFSCPGNFGGGPQGINNRGQIAGACRTEAGGPLHGFIATPIDD